MPRSEKARRSSLPHSSSPKTPRTPTTTGKLSSPLSIPSTPAAFLRSKEDEEEALQKATIRYPGFISKEAFRGFIVDISVDSKDTAAILWMSDSAMLSNSLSPGVSVTVSLPIRSSNLTSADVFPLESLLSMCESQLNVDVDEDMRQSMAGEVGKYFAIAIVWPSRKLQRNEVRLSRHLSYTLGSPTPGRISYVNAFRFSSSSEFVKKIIKPSMSPMAETHKILLYDCVTLNLRLLKESKDDQVACESSSQAEIVAEDDEDCLHSAEQPLEHKHYVKHSNVTTKYPLANCVQNSHTDEAREPAHYGANKDNKSRIRLPSLSEDMVRKALEDKGIKDILERYGIRWLGGRILLRGNVVSIPISGQLSYFYVEDVTVQPHKTLDYSNPFVTADLTDKFTVNETNHEEAHAARSGYVVGPNTHIKFYLDKNSQLNTHPNKDIKSPSLNGNSDSKFDKMLPAFKGHGVSPLGGLSEEISALKEIIYFSLKEPQKLERLGLQPTRGILLYGPPGTGKTSLASACAREAEVNMFVINGPEIVSEYYGESEQALHSVFRSARASAPSVVFIDELDALAPARKEGSEGLSQRMVAALLSLIDGADKNDQVLVISATNRPESIDPALRRPGRLDREFEIGVPSVTQRLEIFKIILEKMKHSITDDNIRSLASETHGFVGADIAALCNEAALSALRRFISQQASSPPHNPSNGSLDALGVVSSNLSELRICSNPINNELATSMVGSSLNDQRTEVMKCSCISSSSYSDLHLTMEDFQIAKLKVRPSAMREVMLEIPKVRWTDIGGQAEVKQQLKEAVEWPQKHSEAFSRIGTDPPKGVLMFGPPGCSKTLMARAVASEAGINFMAVKGPELYSKWVGESEKAIRSLFSKARAASPSIIFFDEIDGLAQAREHENTRLSVGDRVMSQLLVEMDGLKPRVGVTVIAATNRPDKIDPALLRPGRFDRLVYVGPPSKADRKEILDIHMQKMPCSSDISKDDLAALTHGYTGADISALCREAALVALEENIGIREISMRHFQAALDRIQPSEVSEYQKLSSKFQRLVSKRFI